MVSGRQDKQSGGGGPGASATAYPPLHALIIDDELPARSELAFLLDDIPDIKVVGEADNVRDGVALIKEKLTDVIFLDVNMPGVTGIQLADGLKTHPRPPAVVFVTAHSHFAVKAFELNALDYLVKPVELDRLRKTVEKVRNRWAQEDHYQEADVGAQFSTLGIAGVSDSGGTPIKRDDTTKVMVDKAGKKLFIPARDICYITTRDDYSYLFTQNERYLSSFSLTKLERQLEGTSLFRIHRRYLVNLTFITSVTPQSGGTLLVTVEGSEETIPVSRRRVPALKEALNL